MRTSCTGNNQTNSSTDFGSAIQGSTSLDVLQRQPMLCSSVCSVASCWYRLLDPGLWRCTSMQRHSWLHGTFTGISSALLLVTSTHSHAVLWSWRASNPVFSAFSSFFGIYDNTTTYTRPGRHHGSEVQLSFCPSTCVFFLVGALLWCAGSFRTFNHTSRLCPWVCLHLLCCSKAVEKRTLCA